MSRRARFTFRIVVRLFVLALSVAALGSACTPPSSRKWLNDLMCRKNLLFMRFAMSLYAGDNNNHDDIEVYRRAGYLISDTNFFQRYAVSWRYSRDGIHPVCPTAPRSQTQGYEGRPPSGRISFGYFASLWEKQPGHAGKRHVLMSDGQILLIPETKFHALTNETNFLQKLFEGDPDFASCQESALTAGAADGRLDVVTNLVSHATRASIDQALIAAAEGGKLEIVQTLLARGAGVHVLKKGWSRGNLGETALMRAAESNHLEVARLLIEHGADVNAAEGRALWYATFHHYTNLVELLKASGATGFKSPLRPVR